MTEQTRSRTLGPTYFTNDSTRQLLMGMTSSPSYRWQESPTPLTPYQLHVLNELRNQLDHRLSVNSTDDSSRENDNTAAEMFALEYLGLIETLTIDTPRQTDLNWRIQITVRLTLEGYYFISQSFIVQRLIEYISPIPTLHTLVRHVADHQLTGRVTQVYPSGKLRIRWDLNTTYPNAENDLDARFVERYR